jgi:hypothetical protein
MLQDYAWTLFISIPLGVPLLALVYLSACALANRETTFLKSLILGPTTFAISLLVGWLLVVQMGKMEERPDISFGPMHAAGAGLGILASWLIGAIVYGIAYQGAVGKAILVSGLEVLLRVFLAALVTGIVFVVLAIVQVARDETGRDMLITGGIIFAGFLALVTLIFFGSSLLRNRPR